MRAPLTRGADTWLAPSATDLRARLATAHDESIRVERSVWIADSTEESLGRAQDLLEHARSLIGTADSSMDGILSAFDDATSRPRVDGVPVLHDGFTISTASGDFDLRPMNSASLGAVVEAGRSHRLCDLRSGGALDPRVNQGAAIRCADGALREVSAMRSSLGGFRASVLAPAQAETLAAIRGITGSGPVTAAGAADAASLLRGRSRETDAPLLSGANPHRVLNLLA